MKSIDEVNLVDFVCLTSQCKCNSKCDDCTECENEIDKWLAKHDAELLDKVADKLKDEIEKWWCISELDMGADNVNCLIDEVIAEMKAEIEK